MFWTALASPVAGGSGGGSLAAVRDVCHLEMASALRKSKEATEKIATLRNSVLLSSNCSLKRHNQRLKCPGKALPAIKDPVTSCKQRYHARHGYVEGLLVETRVRELSRTVDICHKSVRWAAMKVHAAAVAESREQMLMEAEEAYQIGVQTFQEARDRLADYELYCSLSSIWGSLPCGVFYMTSRPGIVLFRLLNRPAACIQKVWRSWWTAATNRQNHAAVAIQTEWRRKLAMRKWHAVIRLRLMFGSRVTSLYYFTIWRHQTHVLLWARRRIGSNQIHLRRSTFANWKSFTLSTKAHKTSMLRRALSRMREPLRCRAWNGWVDFTLHCRSIRQIFRHALIGRMVSTWRRVTTESRRYKAALSIAVWGQRHFRGFLGRRRAAACVVFCRMVNSYILVKRSNDTVSELLRADREMAVSVYVQRQRKLRSDQLIEEESIRRKKLLPKLEAEERKVEAYLQQKWKRWLNRADVRAEVKLIKSEQAALPRRKRSRKLQSTRAQMVEAKRRLVQRACEAVRLQMTHDFDATNPPMVTCCVPSCRKPFTNYRRYEEHWRADPHPDGVHKDVSLLHLLCVQDHEKLAAHIRRDWGAGPYLNTLKLWSMVESWRKHESESPAFQAEFMAIFTKFLSPNSTMITALEPRKVSAMRTKLELAGGKARPGILDEIQFESLMVLYRDVGPTFWSKNEFKEEMKRKRALEALEIAKWRHVALEERQILLLVDAASIKASLKAKSISKVESIARAVCNRVLASIVDEVLFAMTTVATAATLYEDEGGRKKIPRRNLRAEAASLACISAFVDDLIDDWSMEAIGR